MENSLRPSIEESQVVTAIANCKPEYDEVAALRNQLIQDYPELRRRIIEIDDAYNDRQTAMCEEVNALREAR